MLRFKMLRDYYFFFFIFYQLLDIFLGTRRPTMRLDVFVLKLVLFYTLLSLARGILYALGIEIQYSTCMDELGFIRGRCWADLVSILYRLFYFCFSCEILCKFMS